MFAPQKGSLSKKCSLGGVFSGFFSFKKKTLQDAFKEEKYVLRKFWHEKEIQEINGVKKEKEVKKTF